LVPGTGLTGKDSGMAEMLLFHHVPTMGRAARCRIGGIT
jgi:hypothetical protein